jgi:pyruvate, orthophosphate dikinase
VLLTSIICKKNLQLLFVFQHSCSSCLQARTNGADGIGLTRTEHMFFKTAARIEAVRTMIMQEADRSTSILAEALEAVEEFQRADFEGIFKAMDGLPVTIRLLDPPLHEFLPTVENVEAVEKLAKNVGISTQSVIQKIRAMHEVNPMLGFRGCRLGIAFPEVSRVQVCASASSCKLLFLTQGS